MDFLDFSAEEKRNIDIEINKYFHKLIRDEDDFFLKDFFTRLKKFITPKEIGKGPAKRIRPQVLIYAFFGIASDQKVEAHLEEIRKMSIAIELLHTTSIIHDDVVNQDDLRRGLPTFHRIMGEHFNNRNQNQYGLPMQWGSGAAIHGGDICAFLGASIIMNSHFDNLLKYASLKEFNNGFNSIVRGKIIEHYLLTNSLENSSMEDYLIMAESKTSQQFITAAMIGAILADARVSQIRPLKKAMTRLGVAYQIKNDINDTFREKKKNIALKKRNILLITAYKNACNEDKKCIDDIFNKSEDLTEDEAAKIREIIKSSGTLDFVKIYAQNEITQAITEIDKIY
ncbi:MAG: hypothetical protein GF364_07955, partial [Candidatus Lokiarchaeota archaeon]|nr:hypothetical protein [Candidatus Lokiarchaeota archaeon]